MMDTTRPIHTTCVFDSSAFIALHRQEIAVPKGIWEKLYELMQTGLIISHSTVYSEITSTTSTSPDSLATWIIPKKAYFDDKTQKQEFYVAMIVKKYPKLGYEQADPWLLALALDKSHQNSFASSPEYVVVSQESARSSAKIPAACKEFNIRHLSLEQFLESIGVR